MKLSELASRLSLEFSGDGDIEISGPAPIEVAGAGNVTFLGHPKFMIWAERSAASCFIASPELAAKINNASVLISSNPYLDFARTLEIFFPPYRPGAGIARTADISADASIGDGASIGSFTAIGPGVVVGRRATIHPHVTIYPNVRIGDDFVCHSNVSIRENVTIGNRVIIHNGAVIGADGFGFVLHDEGLIKTPQVGSVIVEDEVEVGANATVDRATIGATVLRKGVKLDNQVHIGHNCEIGDYSRFAAQVGIAGSTRIGKWCEFGGQTGCVDNVRVGDRVRAAGKTGIAGNVPDGTTLGGSPAVDFGRWKRISVVEAKLPEMAHRLRAVEQRLGIVSAKAR